MIEPYKPEYRDEIISLISKVYAEYGDSLCMTGADKDLLDITDAYINPGGRFWVYRKGGQITGTVAVKPGEGGVLLKRLYVEASFRGTGIANELLSKATSWAKAKGYGCLHFWSDTRFERAHAFYLKHGFKKGGTRNMDDGSVPYQEYHFQKPL